MADELTYTISVKSVNEGLTFPVSQTTFTHDAGNPFVSGVVSVGTSEEAIPMGEVATPGLALFRNLDATNYIEILHGTGGDTITRIGAGQASLLHMDPGDTAPYAKANTGACLMFYCIFNA